jgi:hypothetical protein
VVAAYAGLIDTIVVDRGDEGDAADIEGVTVEVEDTLIVERAAATRLGRAILGV